MSSLSEVVQNNATELENIEAARNVEREQESSEAPTPPVPQQLAQSQQLEIGLQGMEAMMNGLVHAMQQTQENTVARAMVMQNLGKLQEEYFKTKVLIAGFKLLEHFENNLETTLRTLDQLVMKATSNITLVSSDGFEKGTGKKVI